MDNYSYFTNIRSEILLQLHKAKREVLIAMAWFTNKELFEACLDCLKRGVKVELILLDDLINHCDFGVNFNQFIELGRGKFYLYPQTKKFLHHKFCIIDGSILITGSYNWTNYAETRNLENIVISYDPKLIKSYTEYFYNIKNELEQRYEFDIINTVQIPEKEFVRRAKDLAEEVRSIPKDISHKFYKQFEKRIERLDIDLQEDLVDRKDSSKEVSKEDNYGGKTNVEVIKVENFKYAVSKYNMGFKANLLDQGGKEGLKVMINKGQVLPFTATCDAQTYDAG